MGKNSHIEWTQHTWNPWRGCHKVSPGCKFCYMFRDQKRYGRDPNTVVRSKTTFLDPLKWTELALVFTCSWSDFFIEEADEWRDDAWAVIREAGNLTFQILTKRPENIEGRLPDNWGDGWDNVWLGVSAECQSCADVRIPILLSIPAKLRFVSVEPMLEQMSLRRWLPDLDWVICGGESGPHQANPKTARPMHMRWARELRDQCRYFGVPFFFKQASDTRPGQRSYIVEEDGSKTVWHQMPERIEV
jgi:protein gp37